ncbi:MAG: hypothetical protein KDA51_10185 [Planctomycetales bacterium]|nr:hypothetical protein [Planctomycetales bacterium]
MRDSRNPFCLQTAESIDSDADFLRLFGHGVLDLLPPDALAGRPLVIRSAPGGGKTSLLKLFTPSVLLSLVAMGRSEATKDLFRRLRELGAVNEHEVSVMSVMLSCARTFPTLADVGLKPARLKRLLLALVDARIISGALRTILIAKRLRFPDDLSRLTLLSPPGESIPGLEFPCNGAAAQQWAEGVEHSVCELIDSLTLSEVAGPAGHDSLLSLRLLDAQSIQLDGKPIETQWLVTFDDMQKLADAQRTALREMVLDQRSHATVWMAERFEALSTQELLTSGALTGRDYAVVALEKEWKARQRFEPAVKLIAERRARMAADSAGANTAPDSFAPTVEVDLDTPEWQERTEFAIQTVRARVEELAVTKPKYSEWVSSQSDVDGTLRQQLIGWRALEILIARDLRKKQRLLGFGPLSREELNRKDGSDVRAAAELFLSEEFGFPYYYGLSRLANLGSCNVEQFLSLAGQLFEESLAAAVVRRPTFIAPDRQQRILEKAFDTRVRDLPQRASNGRAVLHFLDEVGKFCRNETHRSNAPYSPGVTGIAITMKERELLIDPTRTGQSPSTAKFASVLATALAYNLMYAELDYRVKNDVYMVLYLNRLLCPKHHLPLQFGGFREKPLRELIGWMEKGYKPRKSGALQL